MRPILASHEPHLSERDSAGAGTWTLQQGAKLDVWCADMEPQRIAVVGAGTAGAAVGALLVRAGHTVTVFERVADPQPVGAGITLQPTGQATLVRLGLPTSSATHD